MAQHDIVKDDGDEDMYYPIGNTRSVDVTHGCQVNEECNILLLGCGDIRHILHTLDALHEDGTTKVKNQTINFHINDIEDGILARDLVLLYLARTINPSDAEELKTLWAVWYDVLLSNTHLQKLKEVMRKLSDVKSGTESIYFGNRKTEVKIKQALRSWLEFEISGRQTIDKRTDYLTAMYGEHFPEQSVQRVSSRIGAQSNLLDNTQRLKDSCQQEVREYITNGVSKANSTAMTSERILNLSHGNITFFRPGCDNWNVQDNCCSFMCYDVELQLDRYDGGDITMCSLFLETLKKWVKSYQAAIKAGCNIRFHLWLGDAIEVCEADLPDNLLFDFIDTSNIADRLGLIPLLIRCQERLQKPNGVLRTETFHWYRAVLDTDLSLESFLRQCLDVHRLMYPTLIGLHLTEELTLGQENILEDGTFVGVQKFALWWKAAREQEMFTLSAGGKDALSKCLSKLQLRIDGTYVCDTRSVNIAKIDSKSKEKLMHRLSKITTHEAPAELDISTRNSLTVIEEVDHYQVKIKTDPEFPKDGIFTTDMGRGDPYLVVLKNSRNGSTGYSKTLRFACGININSSNIMPSKKRGTIEAHFPKDPSFAEGNRLLPWKKHDADFIVKLPDFPRSSFGEDSIKRYVQWMYPATVPDLQTATPLQQFQAIVLYLMNTVPFSFGVPTNVSIRVPSQADPSNRVDNIFYLEGLKIYENKPTLFLTYIDMDKMSQLQAKGKISQDEILRFLLLDEECIDLDPQSAKYFAPGFSMLMQILELNSYRRAQDYCQEPDKRWVMRTYLRARFPYMDYHKYRMKLAGIPENVIKLVSLIRSQLPDKVQDQTPQSSTHSCDSCGRTSTECKKCTGCHLVFYCDRTCQKKAWPVHKHVCRRT